MKSTPIRVLLAAVFCLAAGGCTLFDPKPPMNIADPKAVVPESFLFTKYKPLNVWLDQPVRVQIFDVPLTRVFETPELRGARYRFISFPPNDPLVFIDKPALTRRQLLWSLSHTYQLHMTPVFSQDGGPAWIEIRSRQISREDEGELRKNGGGPVSRTKEEIIK